MGNEVGSNDLGHEASLVTSNKQDSGNTTRNVGTQKFINIFADTQPDKDRNCAIQCSDRSQSKFQSFVE